MQTKGITWLASYPRSGNTWLRFFLHSLLETIAGTPENEIRISDIERYSQWESDTANFLPFSKDPKKEDFETISKVRPAAQKAMLDRAASSIFVKTHLVLASAHGTSTINNAVTRGAVYLVRDPRDVAVSFAAHLAVSIDVAIAIMADAGYLPPNGVWEFVSSWSENVKSWTIVNSPTVLVMRYEDMVSRPFETFSRITRHVGIQVPQSIVEKAVRLSSFDRLHRQEATIGFGGWKRSEGPFFRRGKVGEWRVALTPGQARRIEEVHAEQMLRFGYPTFGRLAAHERDKPTASGVKPTPTDIAASKQRKVQ